MSSNNAAHTDDVAAEQQHSANRPSGTPFRQQKLPAWQPILTATTVIPAFLLVGIVFVPIGAILITVSDGVQEFELDYERCTAVNEQDISSCHEWEPPATRSSRDDSCTCGDNSTEPGLHFQLEKKFDGQVFFYYALSNFYQNHRRYVRSRNDKQLRGELNEINDCDPFDTVTLEEQDAERTSKKVVPCGAIANSLFNDSFTLRHWSEDTSSWIVVPWTGEGIAWDVDKDSKFRNPDGVNTVDELKAKLVGYERPPSWRYSLAELGEMLPGSHGVGMLNEDFMVWMRTAALPNFRKLYRKLNTTETVFATGLPAGRYKLEVTYRYPVAAFSGGKKFVISTTSQLGAKNNFLGVAYTVVGALCLVMACAFTIIHLKFGKPTATEPHARPRTS